MRTGRSQFAVRQPRSAAGATLHAPRRARCNQQRQHCCGRHGMKLLIRLAAHSAWNRRFTLILMLIAIARASTLLRGIERVRHDMRESFSESVSGTDLVVGARSSPVQLMLYSIDRKSVV